MYDHDFLPEALGAGYDFEKIYATFKVMNANPCMVKCTHISESFRQHHHPCCSVDTYGNTCMISVGNRGVQTIITRIGIHQHVPTG